MNIVGGQIRGALFNFFVVTKCPFCIFWMLPSVSKIILVKANADLAKRNHESFATICEEP